jgi:hypothetical protein
VLLGEAMAAVGPEPHPTLWWLENSEGLYMLFDVETLNGGLNAIAVRLGDSDLLTISRNGSPHAKRTVG